jgi:lysozyme family protein
MAQFAPAFREMIRNEGGYRLVDVPGDRGKLTYAGIARNFHPAWTGWRYVDADDLGNRRLAPLVREFYRAEFWDKISGDRIARQAVAQSLFDFAVNAGVTVAAKLAQRVVGAAPDGRIGPLTLGKLNAMDERVFILRFALAKITRYAEICNKDRSQTKFLLGWVNRTIKDVG